MDERLGQIEVQLGKIVTHMENGESNLERMMENINKILEKHDEVLFGNGKPGVITELDRLKEHRKNTEKTAWVVWSTAIALGIKTLWDFIFHK